MQGYTGKCFFSRDPDLPELRPSYTLHMSEAPRATEAAADELGLGREDIEVVSRNSGQRFIDPSQDPWTGRPHDERTV